MNWQKSQLSIGEKVQGAGESEEREIEGSRGRLKAERRQEGEME